MTSCLSEILQSAIKLLMAPATQLVAVTSYIDYYVILGFCRRTSNMVSANKAAATK